MSYRYACMHAPNVKCVADALRSCRAKPIGRKASKQNAALRNLGEPLKPADVPKEAAMPSAQETAGGQAYNWSEGG